MNTKLDYVKPNTFIIGFIKNSLDSILEHEDLKDLDLNKISHVSSPLFENNMFYISFYVD
jgi:hypothetical protein